MDDAISAIYQLLPEQWAAVVGAVFALLVALRALLLAASFALRGAASVLDRIDLAVDGDSDWKGTTGAMADVARILDGGVRWLDKIAAHGPAQLPVVRGAYERGLPKGRRP